jgi:hypothetical protein
MPNRLAGATSPCLLQHADNPVDWWEWGPEAFEEARRLSKPLLISIGYAACHWCHVLRDRPRGRPIGLNRRSRRGARSVPVGLRSHPRALSTQPGEILWPRGEARQCRQRAA